MARPTVFISSTIWDFADLRFALRYWLQQMGCTVQMSDLNDFERRPNQGTYDSCFNAIQSSDYFVLLVGTRKGSEYSDGVSVTQQEYRVAAQLAREGKIRPIVFVREEVDQLLRGRNADSNLSRGRPGRAKRLPEPGIDDPAFMKRFLDEIKTTEWQRAEPSDGTERHWRYTFTRFDEIVMALQVVLNLRYPFSRQIVLSYLEQELLHNMTHLLKKTHSSTFAFHQCIAPIVDGLELDINDITSDVSIDKRYMTNLVWFAFALPKPDALRTHAMYSAIQSGELLRFDVERQRLAVIAVFQAVVAVMASVERFSQELREYPQLRFNLTAAIARYRTSSGGNIWISSSDMMLLIGIHQTVENIIRLTSSLWIHINRPSDEFMMPDMVQHMPFRDEEERLAAEHVSETDVVQWMLMRHVSGN